MHPILKRIISVSGIFAVFSSVFISCDKLYSDYLQENYHVPEINYLFTEHEINNYVDSLKLLLPFSKENKSLIYTSGGYSFQVKKYAYKGQPVLYIENGESDEYSKMERYYYIRDKELVHIVENLTLSKHPEPYISRRIYFNKGEMLYAEQKRGLNKDDVQNTEYKIIDIEPFDHSAQLKALEDALNQRNKFDLVFEGIAEYSKAKYLIFSKKETSAYRAPVKVETDDEFVRELSANPLRYRGEKLDINWNLNENNEAVYAGGKLSTRN